MIRYGLLIFLAGASCAWGALTVAPRKGQEGNRFLFIVDTSSSMKRLEHSGRQIVFDLVNSGIEGRMRPGDTFGIWTFDNDVKAGVFPVQTWSPEKSTDMATQVARFLKEQDARRGSRLDGAITNAERIIKSVKDLDLVIVTSAATRFKPDDTWAMLLQNYKGRIDEAKKGNKAMLVTLAGRSGQIRQATITLQGERLQLAAPPERRPAPMAKAAPALEPPPKPLRDPIIMRGSPNAKPIEEIPTKFTPHPAAPPVFEPAANPEPSPIPVVGPDKPVVEATTPTAAPIPAPVQPAPAPASQLTVAAREPGVAHLPSPAAPASAVSARMLIIAGATLMVIAGIIGPWAFAHIRKRNRVSYISRSLANNPPDQV